MAFPASTPGARGRMSATHVLPVDAGARRGLDVSWSCPRNDCRVSSRGNTRERRALSRDCADFKSGRRGAIGFGDLADPLKRDRVGRAGHPVLHVAPLKGAHAGLCLRVKLL